MLTTPKVALVNISLLLLEVELMETGFVNSRHTGTLVIASIIGSGINGNSALMDKVDYPMVSLLLLEVELMETRAGCQRQPKPVLSLLLLEVELMETEKWSSKEKKKISIASIIGSGINGNSHRIEARANQGFGYRFYYWKWN